MKRPNSLSLCAIASLGIVVLSSGALAQQKSLKEQLTGAWIIVSNEGIGPDGVKDQPFVHFTGSMFPNQTGTDSKRVVSISGDELRINNPATAAGLNASQVWKRAK